MDMRLPGGGSDFSSPETALGDLDAAATARVVAAASDVALVIDTDGSVKDAAISAEASALGEPSDLIDRRWSELVAPDSRAKINEMLSSPGPPGRVGRWREVNHATPTGYRPYRYLTIAVGKGGQTLALGRDMSDLAGVQQRLLEAQQEMERDYMRLRQAETRYRLLFQMATEPVLICDAANGVISEANPAAGEALGRAGAALAGRKVEDLFGSDQRDQVRRLIAGSETSAPSQKIRARLAEDGRDFDVSASLFRHESASHVLLRLWPIEPTARPESPSDARLLRVLNRVPDAFVLIDEELRIAEANLAFLELANLGDADAARGRSLKSFVGRRDRDLSILQASVREHGWVRNFETVFSSSVGLKDDVEISAVSVPDGLETFLGLVIRVARRRPPASPSRSGALPHTVDQLTDLVGRLPLREIVRETTDVIERLCIETALGLSENNRASAAEMLGLSRQSLYVKLNRYGLRETESSSDNA